MTIHKTKLGDLEMGYAISTLRANGTTHIVAAPEGKGPFLLFSPPEWKPTVLTDGPGGVMSILELPGHDGTIAAIAGCYPVYRFEAAGIYVVHRPSPEESVENSEAEHAHPRHGQNRQNRSGRERNLVATAAPQWTLNKGMDLPFAHRMESVSIGGQPYLIVSTIAAGKANKDDWSRPGTVYAVRVPEQLDSVWESAPILDGITRNHGMHRATIDEQDTLLIGGTQGLIALTVPSHLGGQWERRVVLPREVSEVYAADLDGDGQQELATIEPFHGNQLSVYKRSGDRIEGTWHRLFEADLSYGHGLWAGSLAGEPAVMSGSRAGDKDLSVFSIQSLVPFVAQRSVIENGAGPTQVLVLHEERQDLIFSVNQAMSEVALYTVTA